MKVPHDEFSKEIHSPRFKAILRLTSGRKKRTPDIKSFSHELNSKGVRPFPCWKPRAIWHMNEVMVAVRAKFNGLKEEVDVDLSVFAGDVVGILEKHAEAHPEWKESLEDLLLISRKCAKMSPNEFWLKCENVVQNLDDRRQELPMGTIKQAHTRLLFILTRCTRLLQFQKESGYDEYNILGLHQLSDLGFYSAQIIGTAVQDFGEPLEFEEDEKQIKQSCGQGRSRPMKKQDHVFQPLGNENNGLEVNTARSTESSGSSFRMSSWKKLPSAAQKNQRKDPHAGESTSSDSPDLHQQHDEAKTGAEDHTEHFKASEKVRRVNWGLYDDQVNVSFESLMMCRICEVEIPTIYVEDHSRICTIADRCDLKGLTVNERLERVAGVLERIMDSWSLISTDASGASPDAARVSSSNMIEELDYFSPKQKIISSSLGSDDMLDCVPDADTAFLLDDPNNSPDVTMEMHSLLMHVSESKTSSMGCMTPPSPLLAQSSQIELLLSGRRTIYEHENFQQIIKLLEIVNFVANIRKNSYSSLEYMLDSLEELKYAIQDRKVDALVVETFGRRIEKLFQEKYVELCGRIDDEKMDPTASATDEDSPIEEDSVRSLRASPTNQGSKERTCIEDFEIIKPISRGAFGRVFLARKRATGDLFAIKILRKSDTIRKNAVDSILAERNILISVRNPFVVRFFYSFTCRENLYLVMEYLNGGDLYSLLKNLGCLDEDMARIYIAEIVLALEYLHSLNIIHRDLKPDNLLIGPDGHIKLTDFGLSKVGLINSTEDLSGPSVNAFLDDEPITPPTQSSKKEQRQKYAVVGTPDYLAPEILLGMGHGATADWWSVGIILFELLVGIPPFNAENPQQIFDNIMNRDIPWPKIHEEMSLEAYDLIGKLLIESPVQRLGATGAREVKQHIFFKDINWDTLARQKATFVPTAEGAEDTSYFMSRYLWDAEDGRVLKGSDFDDVTEACSSCSLTYVDENCDICGNVSEFNVAEQKYSFSNFSFKNLSQLASINHDLLVKRSLDASKLFP